MRGLGAISLASAVTNGPLKLAFRRPRPTRRKPLIRPPSSFSFPSGHSASAFAFAAAASVQLPSAAPLLLPLAAAVAYSRVRVRVHRPNDVLLGSALGSAVGLIVGSARLPTPPAPGPGSSTPPDLPRQLILVTSPHAGRSHGIEAAKREMRRRGFQIAEQLEIDQISRLPELLLSTGDQAKLVVAGGGDGTVGAVADALASRGSVLAVVPLGTSNDFARSIGIPTNPRQAVGLLTDGKIATIDLGRLVAPGQPARHFVHAATVGLNVNFAKLATRASIRAHFGRFTYLVAASNALRDRPSFECELHHGGQQDRLTLAQLSVINAPVFGGSLGLSLDGSNPDDRLLDVLAVEDIPAHRMFLAAIYLLLRIKRTVAGVRALHVDRLHVHTGQPLDVALDGEIIGNVPGDFEVAAEALRVVAPVEFEDIDS